jgi:hypothetical protein
MFVFEYSAGWSMAPSCARRNRNGCPLFWSPRSSEVIEVRGYMTGSSAVHFDRGVGQLTRVMDGQRVQSRL